jgi:tripartite ATP-independent transporter DctP family solute receptor
MIKKIFAVICTMSIFLTLSSCGMTKSNQIVLIMADTQEGSHPTAVASDKFAEMVHKKSNGRIKIEVYHGDTLGNENSQVDQVTIDGIDFVRASVLSLGNYDSQLKVFQALYLYDSEDSMWKVLDGSVGNELLNSSSLKSNHMEGLCWFSAGTRNFYNNKRTIASVNDLKGLRIRSNTAIMDKFLGGVGAGFMNISFNDIFASISDGTIDGAENNWPSYISTGHYKVAKYITLDNHSCIPEMIVASSERMSKLSQQDQDIIRQCAKEVAVFQRKSMNEFNDKAAEQAKAAGCVITTLSAEEAKTFKAYGQQYNKEVFAGYEDVINKITGK